MKLTVKDLIAKKSERTGNDFKEVYVDCLGGNLEIRKIGLADYLDMLDGFSENTKVSDAVKMQAEIIYECCPMLHNDELQKAYECVEPTDIVLKVLDDDINAVASIFSEISAFYGDVDSQLKN